MHSLPAPARAFLRGKTATLSNRSAAQLARLFAGDVVQEIRVCWVPKLSGGGDTLCAPFLTPDGLRLRFRLTRSRPFGDVLGVVYRRASKISATRKRPV